MASGPREPIPAHLLPYEVWYRAFTSLVFESFVKGVVREHYHPDPVHVSLQVTPDEAVLYVRGSSGSAILAEDDQLRDWALSFIAVEVFSLEPADVDLIYLDGRVGAQDTYLYIAGRGILIAGDDQHRKGLYL